MSTTSTLLGTPIENKNSYQSLSTMLLEVAKRHPHKGMTFVSYSGEETFMSYSKLVESALQRLHILIRRGFKAGDIAILEISNPFEFYCIFWACIFGGIVVAPVTEPQSFEPGSNKLEKLFNIWTLLNKPILIIEEQKLKYYTQLEQTGEFPSLRLITTADLVSDAMEMAEIYLTGPNTLAILQFSSGSTGTPKGVQLTHQNILANLSSMRNNFELSAKDVAFSWLPHTHDMGLFCLYLTSVFVGSNIFIFSPSTFIRKPYLFLKKISEHRGTWFGSPNFGFSWMMDEITDDDLFGLNLCSLRFVLNGAEPISALVIKNFIKKFSTCGFKETMMRPAYGMAEATVFVSVTKLGMPLRIDKIDRKSMVEKGVAVVNNEGSNSIECVHVGILGDDTDVRIVDRNGNILLENYLGEIQIKGPSVTSGYFQCEKLTADLFHDGWLRTGDLGYLSQSSLVVTGRDKDVVFINGQNYFSHDIEEVLYQNLTNFKRGKLAVVGVYNHQINQEELLIFCVYKSNSNTFSTIKSDVIKVIHTVLGIKVHHVIPIKAIPKTTSGKLQRFQLRTWYESGKYSDILNELETQNEMIQALREIWSYNLGLAPDKFSIDDDFFALGGTSLKAYQLFNEIEKYFKKDINIEILILCKTIRQMHVYLSSENKIRLTQKSELDNTHSNYYKSIAITGIGLRLPHANTQEEFWDLLVSQKDCIQKISAKRRDLTGDNEWNDWLGELEDIDHFDHEFFDISEDEARFMDPQQRLALETSYEALEDAGLIKSKEESLNIGVYSGISINTYYQLVARYLRNNGIEALHQRALLGNLCNMVSSRIAGVHNFTGPALTIDTACSSFLVALHHAVLALRTNSIAGALVIGSNLLVTSEIHSLSSRAGILSSTKHAKVFDKDSDGTVLGEGVLAFYLEPLENAIKTKKNIYGVIRGTAVNNDGTSFSSMAPNPSGQYDVLSKAYSDAKMKPTEIDYIEVHGTGTAIGDPIEINVLSKFFKKHGEQLNRVGIGSVKTNVGHLLPCSGAVGLAKILLSFKYQTLVPSLNLTEKNPALKLETSPFYIVQDVKKWEIMDEKTRKASVSAFGLGGTNAHIILEEWRADVSPNPAVQPDDWYLLTLSAKTKNALEALSKKMQVTIEDNADISLQDLCFTRNQYRKHYAYRMAFLISKTRQIKRILSGNDYFFKSHSPKAAIILAEDNPLRLLCVKKLQNCSRNVFCVSNEKECLLHEVVLQIRETGIASSNIELKDSKKYINITTETGCTLNEHVMGVIGELYVAGIDFEWGNVHQEGSGKLVHLPPYPFEKSSHWI